MSCKKKIKDQEVTIKESEYRHLSELRKYANNWYPNYWVCPECGSYNPKGYICIECRHDDTKTKRR